MGKGKRGRGGEEKEEKISDISGYAIEAVCRAVMLTRSQHSSLSGPRPSHLHRLKMKIQYGNKLLFLRARAATAFSAS